jgi:hypothetical protein
MKTQSSPDQSRHEGVGGLEVILADGQAWTLALPTVRLRPRLRAGVDAFGRKAEIVEVATEFGHPVAIRQRIERLRESCSAEPASEQYDALFQLGVALLLRAHDLELETAASLFEVGIEELPRLIDAILAAALGDAREPRESFGKDGCDA